MKHFAIILGKEEGDEGESCGVNLTKVQWKHIKKGHNECPLNN
jgi:hypothetical protein